MDLDDYIPCLDRPQWYVTRTAPGQVYIFLDRNGVIGAVGRIELMPLGFRASVLRVSTRRRLGYEDTTVDTLHRAISLIKNNDDLDEVFALYAKMGAIPPTGHVEPLTIDSLACALQ